MRVAGRVLLMSLGTLFFVGLAQASDKTYTIGVENLEYYPAYTMKDGEYGGYMRELFDTFAQERGYRFVYKALPVNRLFSTFVHGQVDFKFPDNPNWQQDMRTDKHFTYSDPVVDYLDGTMVRPDMKDASVEQIAQLATVSGFTPWAWMDQIRDGKVTLRESIDVGALAQQVLAKRVDAAYANVAVAHHQLDLVLKTPDALVFNRNLPHSRDSYYFSTVNHPEVIADFNAWQTDRADFVRALKEKYAVEKGVKE